MTQRVRIGRLELDMRGLEPAAAMEAAQLLGPALAKALRNVAPGSANRIEAGRIAVEDRPDPHRLATQMAGRLAQRLGGGS